jgi:hypothetical protein
MPILGTIASQVPANLPTNSFYSIATVTVGSGGESNITFSSIPQTYKHLQLRILSAGNYNTSVRLRVNADSDFNYHYHGLQAGNGYGNSVYSYAANTQNSMMVFDQQLGNSSYFNSTIVDILDYTAGNKSKTFRTFSGVQNNTDGFIYRSSGLWTGGAISQMVFYFGGGDFFQYSKFALYGIKE